jgi:hypothetical protein
MVHQIAFGIAKSTAMEFAAINLFILQAFIRFVRPKILIYLLTVALLTTAPLAFRMAAL